MCATGINQAPKNAQQQMRERKHQLVLVQLEPLAIVKWERCITTGSLEPNRGGWECGPHAWLQSIELRDNLACFSILCCFTEDLLFNNILPYRATCSTYLGPLRLVQQHSSTHWHASCSATGRGLPRPVE
jgi:hypothetical protein